MKDKSASRLHFAWLIFLVSLLFTFLLWDVYFNSGDPMDRTLTANLILLMGTLFSAAAGLFAWSLESRREFLEKELVREAAQITEKNLETKEAEVVSAAIYQSCHILYSEVKVNSVLERVMDLLSKVLRADEGSIMLLDETHHLKVAASRGIPLEIARSVSLKIGERVAGRAAQLRREFLIVDSLENYPEFEGIEPNPRIRSSIVCPLICQNELLGVLNLNRTVMRENFTTSDLMNASIFALQVAQSLRNAMLYEKLEKQIAELAGVHQRISELETQIGKG